MKLFLEENYAEDIVRFWIKKETKNGTDKFIGFDKGKLTEYNLDGPTCVTGINMKPFLELRKGLADDFIRLIAEHAQSKGIRTEKQDSLEGELKATKEHLETLKKITFKLTKITE